MNITAIHRDKPMKDSDLKREKIIVSWHKAF
jgi:hypothetical protein